MACTILRLVQAAVSLRRRFECAIQSSFESVDGGDSSSQPDILSHEDENPPLNQTQPKPEDLVTGEQLSHDFQITFDTADKELEQISGKDHLQQSDEIMTFLSPNDIVEEKDERRNSISEACAHSINEEQSQGRKGAEKHDKNEEIEVECPEQKPTINEFKGIHPSANIEKTNGKAIVGQSTGAIPKTPSLTVNETEISESDTTDSDTITSVKSVRLRHGDAISPSSGCKPAKLVRSNALETTIDNESNNSKWLLMMKGSKTQLVYNENNGNSDETSEAETSTPTNIKTSTSDSDDEQWDAYSNWISKGKESLNDDETGKNSDDGDDENMNEDAYQTSFDVQDEDDSECIFDYIISDDEEIDDDENYDEDDDDDFIDDGFCSLDFDDSIIIEENEEDLQREMSQDEMVGFPDEISR